MALPNHNIQHDALMQLLMQASQGLSEIEDFILISVDAEGRPAVSSTFNDVGITTSGFRQLGEAEKHITGVSYHELKEPS